MKRVSYGDITVAGATSRGVSAQNNCRCSQAETFYFAEPFRDNNTEETSRKNPLLGKLIRSVSNFSTSIKRKFQLTYYETRSAILSFM
jgi:hypothetical protein